MQVCAKTIKLYEQDSFLTACTTTLCALKPDKTAVALAKTIFFAEGGGQPCDKGTITFATAQGAQTATVIAVHEVDGILWHTLQALPDGLEAAIGCAAQCTLDWAHRLDSMQQHTGEHILSGILHQLYGAENVGFHIGSSLVRMDITCPLTPEQLRTAEDAANEIIWQNVAIETLLPTAEALADLNYRSKKAIDGQVRIVRIAGADTCACCGTHLCHSGQVGQIKIITAEHYKGGMRLSVVCGKRALCAAQEMRDREAEIGALLSAKPALTASAVQRVYAEYNQLKFEKQGIEAQLFDALAAQITPQGTAPVVVTVPGLSPDGLHKLATTLTAHTENLCVALCPSPDGTRIAYCLAQQGDADLRALCKALNMACNGRGGGKANICQGSALASTEAIAAFIQGAV